MPTNPNPDLNEPTDPNPDPHLLSVFGSSELAACLTAGSRLRRAKRGGSLCQRLRSFGVGLRVRVQRVKQDTSPYLRPGERLPAWPRVRVNGSLGGQLILTVTLSVTLALLTLTLTLLTLTLTLNLNLPPGSLGRCSRVRRPCSSSSRSSPWVGW